MNQLDLFFVLTQDFESEFKNTTPGRIMRQAQFKQFTRAHGPVTAVAVYGFDRALEYAEFHFPEYLQED